MHDYYSILGVEKTATPDQIRTAYRTLARSVHPDHQANGAGLAALLNEAYEVLSDADKRAAYDRRGAADNVRVMPGPAGADIAGRIVRPDGSLDFLGVLGVMVGALPPDAKQHIKRSVHPFLDALGFQGEPYQPQKKKGKKHA